MTIDIVGIITNKLAVDYTMLKGSVRGLEANMLKTEWADLNDFNRTLTNNLNNLKAQEREAQKNPGWLSINLTILQQKIDALVNQINSITEQIPPLERRIFAAEQDLNFYSGWKQSAQSRLNQAYQSQQGQ